MSPVRHTPVPLFERRGRAVAEDTPGPIRSLAFVLRLFPAPPAREGPSIRSGGSSLAPGALPDVVHTARRRKKGSM